jgi:5,10-methylenetetrahydromethanopterin reductase
LAAKGPPRSAVEWARAAARAGLESVWIHDSYFERDAVTYASAIAAQVEEIRIGLGAVNPFTRNPVLLAMTMSALDAMAPGRTMLGLGTGRPRKLAQMGLRLPRVERVAEVRRAIATMRALWRGEAVPSGSPDLPPIQPEFPPVDPIPILAAGTQLRMLEVAATDGDGYLARSAESAANVRSHVEVVREAARRAGRQEELDVAAYVFAFVGKDLDDAAGRVRRIPFVIYMMTVQSDESYRHAGFDTDLRERIAQAWLSKEVELAGRLVPTELLEQHLLLGTLDEVSAGIARYREAGVRVPILQPALQDDEQVELLIRAGVREALGAPA